MLGSVGQHQALAGGSLALVGHHLDRQNHTIKYIDLAHTTVDRHQENTMSLENHLMTLDRLQVDLKRIQEDFKK